MLGNCVPVPPAPVNGTMTSSPICPRLIVATLSTLHERPLTTVPLAITVASLGCVGDDPTTMMYFIDAAFAGPSPRKDTDACAAVFPLIGSMDTVTAAADAWYGGSCSVSGGPQLPS